jgi:TRAP-type C4-dicarboxylate transport system substrate-binding protein
MNKRSPFLRIALCLALAGLTAAAFGQSAIRIRIGTAAPEGSIWHEVLQQMEQDWERIAPDRLNVTIYPGGSQGDEAAMLGRVRTGLLQGVALSGAGLSQADDGVSALLVPMMLASWEELDYVWERLTPTLEQRLEREGFVVLNWGDVGWVYFFTKRPARTPDDVRGMRLFTSAGDPETERLYREFRFNPVPMSVTDMLPNLVTGVIDAFSVPPLFALADQSFSQAPHLLDMKWAPLVGATLIRRDTWEQIPEDLRPRLLQAAREAAERRREEIRLLGDSSIDVMKDNGLGITPVDRRLRRLWRTEAENAWDAMRGTMAPAGLFDEVLRLRARFRSAKIENLLIEANATDTPVALRRIYSTILDELDPEHGAATAGLIAALMDIAGDTDDAGERRSLYTEVLDLDPDHEAAGRGLAAIE